jgi:hypothetical protein
MASYGLKRASARYDLPGALPTRISFMMNFSDMEDGIGELEYSRNQSQAWLASGGA